MNILNLCHIQLQGRICWDINNIHGCPWHPIYDSFGYEIIKEKNYKKKEKEVLCYSMSFKLHTISWIQTKAHDTSINSEKKYIPLVTSHCCIQNPWWIIMYSDTPLVMKENPSKSQLLIWKSVAIDQRTNETNKKRFKWLKELRLIESHHYYFKYGFMHDFAPRG